MTIVLSLVLGLAVGALLGGLGGGGAILTVPILVYILGESPQAATATSLVIVGLSALVGAAGHARQQHVRWGTGIAFGVCGVVSAVAGTALNRLVDPAVLLIGFGAVMVLAAAAMLRNAATPATGTPDVGRDPHAAPGSATRGLTLTVAVKVLVGGLVVGFLTGFFGVGGGFIIVPILVLMLGMSMPAAVGTSLLVIAINSAVSLIARAGHFGLDAQVVIPFAIAAMAGTFAGRRIAGRLPGKTLTKAFAVLLIVVAAYVLARSLLQPG